MASTLPLPPPQVPLVTPDGKLTQQGFEFLDRLQMVAKALQQKLLISVNSADPTAPPTQAAPVAQTIAVGGLYADSGSGNIFQISSWADNSGTRPTVAVFGQGRATGTSGRVWGGNFVGYAAGTGAFAQAVEIDFGVTNGVSFQQGWGLAINAGGNTAGGTGNTTLGINFDSLGAGGTYNQAAIRFNNAGLVQPFTNALLATGNSGGALTAPFGIDFSNASFGTAAIKTNGFLVDGTGHATIAMISVGTPTNANASAAGVPLGGLYRDNADPAKVYIRTV